MKIDFQTFISQLAETNAKLDYFTDFSKIKSNISKVAIKLNQLNYLIGKDDLLEAVTLLYEENPKVFDVLPILIAVRSSENKTKVMDADGKVCYMQEYLQSPALVCQFLIETGLADVLASNDVKSLVDYVFGVEVGLDTNARKNRGGTVMSQAIATAFRQAGIVFSQEVSSFSFPEMTSLGVDKKVFDFVIKTPKTTFLIEANFYNSGGSKLNEVARSYSDLAPKINQYANLEFVWITDGQGWLSAKNKLEEAYSLIPRVYNLSNLKEFINEIKVQLANQGG